MSFNIKSFLKRKSTLCKLNYNNFNLSICKTLLKNGLISHYKKLNLTNKNYLIIYFKYFENKNVIRDIKQISKYSRTITTNDKNIKYKKNSLLINTNNGLYLQSNYKNYRIGGQVCFFLNC